MKIEKIDPIIAALLKQDCQSQLNVSELPFEPNVEAMNAWHNELPIINTPKACEMALKAMASLHATELTGTLRYQLTEKFRPCPFELLNSSEDKFLFAKFPLSNNVKQLVAYSISFQNSLAAAYINVINSADFISDTSKLDPEKKTSTADFFSEEIQATVIHRAMQSLGLVLLKSAQTYEFPPKAIWGQVNALFNLAEKNGLLYIAIIDSQFIHSHQSNICSLFKRLQFFTLSSPNRFSQREIKSIYRLLEESSDLLSLSMNDTEQGKQASFFINLNSDKPTAHISKLEEAKSDTHYFHTSLFIEHICSDEVSKKNTGETFVDLSNKTTHFPEHTVRRLLQCWHQNPSRQFTRTVDQRPVTIYPNLQNLLKKLLGTTTKKTGVDKQPINRGHLDINKLDLVPIDSSSTLHHERAIRSERVVEGILKNSRGKANSNDIWKKAALNKPTGEAESFDSNIADTSATGYQVNIQHEKASQVKAGDLVGITIADGSLEIAVIRRLMTLDNGSVSMGVELIAPNAQVAKILNIDDDIRSRYVLMLPAIPAIKQAASILSPSVINLPGDVILLSIDSNKQHYKIQKMLVSNAAYTHYTLEKHAVDL